MKHTNTRVNEEEEEEKNKTKQILGLVNLGIHC